jgi:glc operon protein GlcG
LKKSQASSTSIWGNSRLIDRGEFKRIALDVTVFSFLQPQQTSTLEDTLRLIVSMTLAVCAIAVVNSPASAQTSPPITPPAPPSAGGTPDAIPFDVPYGTSIGLERAKQVMAAAEAEAKRRNWKMNIAVVDTNGELVEFARMEGAQIASGPISIGKARTSARFRRESRAFYNAYETGHPYTGTLDPTLVASPGGFPLVEGGKLIGAVGCSGGTGDQDATICKAGAEVVK